MPNPQFKILQSQIWRKVSLSNWQDQMKDILNVLSLLDQLN